MATYSSKVSNNYQWFIDVTESNVNQSKNTSDVTVKFYMKKVGVNSTSYNNYGTTAEIVINNIPYSITGFKFDLRNAAVGTTKTIMTKTVTIKHGSDGSRTVSILASHWTDLVAGNYPQAHVQVTANLALSTIANESLLSVPSGTFNIGSNVAINIKPYDARFTHALSISLDQSSWTDINPNLKFNSANVNHSYTFTIPTKYKSNVASQKTGTLYIRLYTFAGTKRIGSSIKSIKIKNNDSTLAINDFYITSDTYKENGAYVAGKTAFKVRCNITNSSSLKSITYYVTGAHIQNATFSTNVSNYLTWATTVVKNSGTVKIKIEIRDNAGNVVTRTITATVGKTHTLNINNFYITSDTYKSNGNYIPGKTAFKVKCDLAHSDPIKSIRYDVTGAYNLTNTFTTNLNNYLTWATPVVKNSGTIYIKITITDTAGYTVTRTITAVLSNNHKLTIDNFYITTDTYKENNKYVAGKTAFKVRCHISHTHSITSIKYETTGAHKQSILFNSNMGSYTNYLTWATTVVKNSGTINFKVTITDSYGYTVTKTISATIGQVQRAHYLSVQDSYIDTSVAVGMKNGSYYKGVSRIGLRLIISRSHIVTSLTVTVGSKVYELNPCRYVSGTAYTCPEAFSTQGNVPVKITIKDDQGYTDTKTFSVFVDQEVSDPDAPVIRYEGRTDSYVLLSEGEKITFTGKSTNIKDYQVIYALSSCDVINATSIYTSSSSYNGANRAELSNRLKANANGSLRYVIYKDFDKDDKAIYQDANQKNTFHLHPTSPNHSSSDRFYALQWFEHAKPGDMVYVYVIERTKKIIVEPVVPPTPTPKPSTPSLSITSFYITSDTYSENGAYVSGKTAFKTRCEVSHINKISNIKYEVTGAHSQKDNFNPPSSNYFTWATTVVNGTGAVNIKVTVTDTAGNVASKTITAQVGANNAINITKFYITSNTYKENNRYIAGKTAFELRVNVTSKYLISSVKYQISGAHSQIETFNPPDLKYLLWSTTVVRNSGTITFKVTITDIYGNTAHKSFSTVVYPSSTYYSLDKDEPAIPAIYNADTRAYTQFDEEVYDNSGNGAFLTMFKYVPFDLFDNPLTATVDLEGDTTNFYFRTFIGEDAIVWEETTYHTGNGYINPTGNRSYININLPYTYRNKVRNYAEPFVFVKIEVYTRSGRLHATLVCRVWYKRPSTQVTHKLDIKDFYITKDTYNENGKYVPGKTAFKVKCSVDHTAALKSITYYVTGAHIQNETFTTNLNNYLTWATTVVQNSGSVSIKIEIRDVAGYTVTRTITANLAQLKETETYKYSTHYKYNQIPRSLMFPMCVIPPAPGAIQIYEKTKTDDKYVIQYKNPIYNWNIGDKNPIHLIDVCLIATDSKGNVLNTNENKKRDGKNGKCWIYYSDRQWHNIVPKSVSGTNNSPTFTMEFDISKYPKGSNISVVAFYYSDYYIHPSIYSTSNVLRTDRQNVNMSLSFIEPMNNAMLSDPNPNVKVRVFANSSASTTSLDPIYHYHNLATNWNKEAWNANPIWFRVPRSQNNQLPNFKESERCKLNSPYGKMDYPTHKVEFYKHQESIYKTAIFEDSSLSKKNNGIYLENELYLRLGTNIIDLGEIDTYLLMKNKYLDFEYKQTEGRFLKYGENKLEAYTCPYKYGSSHIDFIESNGNWLTSNSFVSESIMPYNIYRKSIIRPNDVLNWDEVSSEVLQIKIPYNYLEPDCDYKLSFNSRANDGFEYEYDTYSIFENEEANVCISYMFLDVLHSHLKNVIYNKNNIVYRPSYKIVDGSKEVDLIDNYNKDTYNEITFKAPNKNNLEQIGDKDSFIIKISTRGIDKLNLTDLLLTNVTKNTKQSLSPSKQIDNQKIENLTYIKVNYTSFDFKFEYIDPLNYDDMMSLRDYLLSLSSQYSINISPPWREITKDSSYLMARDFNDIKDFCYNLFSQVKRKYSTTFKGNPEEFKTLPTIKAGESRVVAVNSAGKPSVDKRGKTYFSEWDDLIDILKKQKMGQSTEPTPPSPPVVTPPSPPVTPTGLLIKSFKVNNKETIGINYVVETTNTTTIDAVIITQHKLKKAVAEVVGVNNQVVTKNGSGSYEGTCYYSFTLKFPKVGRDKITFTVYDVEGNTDSVTVSTYQGTSLLPEVPEIKAPQLTIMVHKIKAYTYDIELAFACRHSSQRIGSIVAQVTSTAGYSKQTVTAIGYGGGTFSRTISLGTLPSVATVYTVKCRVLYQDDYNGSTETFISTIIYTNK